MHAVFVDATPALAGVARRLRRPDDMPLTILERPDITSEALPELLGDAEIVWIDHTHVPTAIGRRCAGLRHVIFLGTGARSYMNPQELAGIGIEVHIIKGYGDVAVAEMAVSLIWAAARRLALMDRGMRAGQWLRTEGVQLSGKTLGLIGFGGIASEVARLSPAMRILAWNRTPKSQAGVTFVGLTELLKESHVVSLHLLLTDETRGFIGSERLALMRPDAILVNTARGALVEESAMIEALKNGSLGHAALDVFDQEPLPAGHPLTELPNVTLSAHSAFRTPEATDNLIEAAFEHCRRIAGIAEPAG
jgi:D-3-phosphoglycerate dehydrogenase